LQAAGASSYTWNTGSTLSSIVVSPTTGTSYTVTGADANGCKNTRVFQQNVSPCTALDELNELFLSIFPNPNNGDFTIQSKSPAHITIVNELGQLVQGFDVEGSEDRQISGLSSGIYFIIVSGNSRHITQKVIITK
jgi:hypothetical protein